jgi:hypothetical protein
VQRPIGCMLLNETDPSKALPHKLRETVDAIRKFGSRSAHPIDDKTTLQVIDVEPHEAEWCVEIGLSNSHVKYARVSAVHPDARHRSSSQPFTRSMSRRSWRRPAQDSIIDAQNKLGTAAGEAAGWDLRRAVRNGLGADLFRGSLQVWIEGIASIGPDGRRVGSR